MTKPKVRIVGLRFGFANNTTVSRDSIKQRPAKLAFVCVRANGARHESAEAAGEPAGQCQGGEQDGVPCSGSMIHASRVQRFSNADEARGEFMEPSFVDAEHTVKSSEELFTVLARVSQHHGLVKSEPVHHLFA
ncbi:MAG: hypothetical protein ACI89X_003178 [Planctomycetota bacterium]